MMTADHPPNKALSNAVMKDATAETSYDFG